MSGFNAKVQRKQRAEKRVLELRAAMETGPVERGPVTSPQPGVLSDGTFSSEQYRHDMAMRWLGGYVVERQNGLLTRVYLDGEDERDGRQALAELLWEGNPSEELVQLLAMYVAPEGSELADSDFRLKIESRRRGAARNSESVLQVGLFVMDEVKAGHSVEDSIATASTYFGLGKRQVKTYWARFRRSHESTFRELEASRDRH